MNCARVDELAAAYALGALPAEERAAIVEHLSTCEREHALVREALEATVLLAASLEPVSPPPELRGRIMATVVALGREAESGTSIGAGVTDAGRNAAAAGTPRGSGLGHRWRAPRLRLQLALALGGALAFVLVGAWGVATSQRLAEQEQVLREIASADAIYPVKGSAGVGWLMVRGDAAMFVTKQLESPPPGRLYELWLINRAGTPIPAGAIERSADLTIVAVRGSLRDAAAFAVTVEQALVEQPTGPPVLIAQLRPEGS